MLNCIYDENDYRYRSCEYPDCNNASCTNNLDLWDKDEEEVKRFEEQIQDNAQEFEKNK